MEKFNLFNSNQLISEIYKKWIEGNKDRLSQNNLDLVGHELLLNPETDDFKGLNVIARFESNNWNKISDNIKTFLGSQFEDQWVIPESDIHLTVLDPLPHNAGFSMSEIKSLVPEYIEIFNSLSLNKPIQINFQGLFASPNGLTLQGYPTDSSLLDFRQKLRKSLSQRGLYNNEDLKYKIITAHVAFAKLITPIAGQTLLDLTHQSQKLNFGTAAVSQLELNISPRFDKSKTIEILSTKKF